MKVSEEKLDLGQLAANVAFYAKELRQANTTLANAQNGVERALVAYQDAYKALNDELSTIHTDLETVR